jgi:hypothetical protein
MRDLGYNGPVVVEHLFPVRDQLFHTGVLAAEAGEIAGYLRENLLAGRTAPSSEEPNQGAEGKEIGSNS